MPPKRKAPRYSDCWNKIKTTQRLREYIFKKYVGGKMPGSLLRLREVTKNTLNHTMIRLGQIYPVEVPECLFSFGDSYDKAILLAKAIVMSVEEFDSDSEMISGNSSISQENIMSVNPRSSFSGNQISSLNIHKESAPEGQHDIEHIINDTDITEFAFWDSKAAVSTETRPISNDYIKNTNKNFLHGIKHEQSELGSSSPGRDLFSIPMSPGCSYDKNNAPSCSYDTNKAPRESAYFRDDTAILSEDTDESDDSSEYDCDIFHDEVINNNKETTYDLKHEKSASNSSVRKSIPICHRPNSYVTDCKASSESANFSEKDISIFLSEKENESDDPESDESPEFDINSLYNIYPHPPLCSKVKKSFDPFMPSSSYSKRYIPISSCDEESVKSSPRADIENKQDFELFVSQHLPNNPDFEIPIYDKMQKLWRETLVGKDLNEQEAVISAFRLKCNVEDGSQDVMPPASASEHKVNVPSEVSSVDPKGKSLHKDAILSVTKSLHLRACVAQKSKSKRTGRKRGIYSKASSSSKQERKPIKKNVKYTTKWYYAQVKKSLKSVKASTMCIHCARKKKEDKKVCSRSVKCVSINSKESELLKKNTESLASTTSNHESISGGKKEQSVKAFTVCIRCGIKKRAKKISSDRIKYVSMKSNEPEPCEKETNTLAFTSSIHETFSGGKKNQSDRPLISASLEGEPVTTKMKNETSPTIKKKTTVEKANTKIGGNRKGKRKRDM